MPHTYRAEHVGSLLRPQALLQARADPAFSRDELRALEDREILRLLRRQQELGLTLFTDGELRRRTFMSDFNESVDGLDDESAIARDWQGERDARPSTVSGIARRRLRQTKRLTDHEVGFLQQHSPGAIKVTLPSANQFPAIAWQRGLSDAAYPTHSDLLWDCVPIIRDEIRALADEGVQYIQIDAPRYSYYIDPKWRTYIREEIGKDPDAALDEAIAADNSCLEGVARDGLTLAIHLCRGNNRSQWYAEGGYDPIAEKLFGRLNVDAFLLEYESERAGSFAPLRFVPPGKQVVLGLVSSKLPELESREQLVRRIEEASRYLPLDRLALSPQCGFASTMEGNLLSEDDQWRKLELVVETARSVWPS